MASKGYLCEEAEFYGQYGTIHHDKCVCECESLSQCSDRSHSDCAHRANGMIKRLTDSPVVVVTEKQLSLPRKNVFASVCRLKQSSSGLVLSMNIHFHIHIGLLCAMNALY